MPRKKKEDPKVVKDSKTHTKFVPFGGYARVTPEGLEFAFMAFGLMRDNGQHIGSLLQKGKVPLPVKSDSPELDAWELVAEPGVVAPSDAAASEAASEAAPEGAAEEV